MAITKEPGLNSGLPSHGSGLDPDTKAAMERNANKDGKGVIVGGTQDVQRYFGELAKDASEPAVTMPPGEDESSPTSLEHAAATATTGTSFDDSYTVDELKAELESRGEPTSGTKQELLDRLNG